MNQPPISEPESNGATVAIVANLAWSVYNFRMPVVRALRDAGYRVVVVVPVDESVSALMKEPGVELVALRYFRRNSTSISAGIKMIAEFRQVYLQLKPDLIIHFGVQANVFGNFAARLAGVKSICVVTGLGYTFLHKGLVPMITRLLYRLSFLKTAKVVFENREDLDLMVKSGLVNETKTLHIPGCGIDTQYFKPEIEQQSTGGPVFTLIGRLLYDKGVREFAAAAARLKITFPEAECHLLGHLDDENPAHIHRTELVNWVRSGFIQYKGATDDVRPFIQNSDWIVLPSYREGLSRVLLEAMAMEKPLITTDTPGCRETVTHGKNGYLVPVGDENLLYETMLKACSVSLEERQEMGRFGREKAEKEYSTALVSEQYKLLISNLLKK